MTELAHSTLAIDEIADPDVDPVVELWRACGLTRPWNDPHTDIAFARQAPTSTLLVARLLDVPAIIGSVMVGHDGHRGWCYYLAVSPRLQGNGYGRCMMEAAEGWLLDQGIWKCQLLVRTGNEKVVRFYQTLGYDVSQTQVLERWIDPSKCGDASTSEESR